MIGIVHDRHRMIFADLPTNTFDGNVYRYVRVNGGLMLHSDEGVASELPVFQLRADGSLLFIQFHASAWLISYAE